MEGDPTGSGDRYERSVEMLDMVANLHTRQSLFTKEAYCSFLCLPKETNQRKGIRYLSVLSGSLRLHMKNGCDVAALSHFPYLLRQLLHAFLYLLHPCSRRQPAERGAGAFIEVPIRTWMCGFSKQSETTFFDCVERTRAGCSESVGEQIVVN